MPSVPLSSQYKETRLATSIQRIVNLYPNTLDGGYRQFPGLVEFADLSDVAYSNVNFDLTQSDTETALRFSTDGSKMWTAKPSTDQIIQYSLSTPYNVSTATYQKAYTFVHSGVSNIVDFAWNADNTKLVVIDSGYSTLVEYSLSGDDVATLATTGNTQAVSFSGTLYAGTWNSDGSELWLSGLPSGSNVIKRYDTGTAYTIGSMGTQADVAIESTEPDIVSMYIHPDGTDLFLR